MHGMHALFPFGFVVCFLSSCSHCCLPANMQSLPHINTLVMSGGGPLVFQHLGMLQHWTESSPPLFSLSQIQTIHGTSAGALAAVLLALRFDWDTLRTFLLCRPWQKVFALNWTTLSLSLATGFTSLTGMFSESVWIQAFQPLFQARGWDASLTLQELYEYSGIDVHMYTYELNHNQTVDISHTTHPTWTVLSAIHMSCAIPLLFSPVLRNDLYTHEQPCCFVDGGLQAHFPLPSLSTLDRTPDMYVLGLVGNHTLPSENTHDGWITSQHTMWTFASTVLMRMLQHAIGEHTHHLHPRVWIWHHDCTQMSLTRWLEALQSSATRLALWTNHQGSWKGTQVPLDPPVVSWKETQEETLGTLSYNPCIDEFSFANQTKDMIAAAAEETNKKEGDDKECKEKQETMLACCPHPSLSDPESDFLFWTENDTLLSHTCL